MKIYYYGMPDPPNWFPKYRSERIIMRPGMCTAREMADRLEPEDRDAVLEYLNFPTLPVGTIGEMIQNAVVQWNYTRQGWNYWRDMHNKYTRLKAKKMSGLYESDGDIGYLRKSEIAMEPIEPVRLPTLKSQPGWH